MGSFLPFLSVERSPDLALVPPPAGPLVAAPAARDRPLPPDPGLGEPRAAADFLWKLLALAAGMSAVCYGYQVLLGCQDPAHNPHPFAFVFPVRYFVFAVLFLGATVFLTQREWTMAVVTGACVYHVYATEPRLLLYAAGLVPALYLLLGRADRPGVWASVRFWLGVLFGLVLLPKGIQAHVEHYAHGSWLDANQDFFAGLFLRYAYYYYERRRGLVPGGRFWEHAAYLLFVPQITGMLNLPPSEMAERWGLRWEVLRRGFAAVGWAAVKIPVVLWLERAVLPGWGYGRGYGALHAAPRLELWACLLVVYFYWAVLISLKFDLMAALFRFFGVNVDDNFRWALLATSPVALWQRWNIYNRRLLLKFVYFPLGGNRRHVYRNILCTFLGSALILHTGYCGSPWLGLDPGQLRDWLLYFAGQGVLVCAAYWWLNRPFWERLTLSPWRVPLRGLGWAFTLGSSAWLHVLPLAASGGLLNADIAPVNGLDERLSLMWRALGG